MDALKTYYDAHDGGDNMVRMKVCQAIGQLGIPVAFAVFAAVYWILGMAKYFSG